MTSNQFVEDPQAITIGKMVVVMYLVGLIFPVLYVVGLVMAYVFRQDAKAWMVDNFRFLIRTFWLGILFWIIAGLLCFLFIGFILIPLIIVWWVIRCVVVFRLIEKGSAHQHPATWGI